MLSNILEMTLMRAKIMNKNKVGICCKTKTTGWKMIKCSVEPMVIILCGGDKSLQGIPLTLHIVRLPIASIATLKQCSCSLYNCNPALFPVFWQLFLRDKTFLQEQVFAVSVTTLTQQRILSCLLYVAFEISFWVCHRSMFFFFVLKSQLIIKLRFSKQFNLL